MMPFNPAQMKKVMQQLGMKTEEIKAKKVVIELEDKRIIIEEPMVSAIELQGQKTYTILGKEKIEESFSAEDIELVMEQTKKSKEEAIKALKETQGNIAEAIMKLKEN